MAPLQARATPFLYLQVLEINLVVASGTPPQVVVSGTDIGPLSS